MKNYTFKVVCASGATKEFTCQADDQKEALRLLREFAQVN
jgi:hypothetical protein